MFACTVIETAFSLPPTSLLSLSLSPRNVLQQPREEKYRRLSTSSKSFSENVWQYPSAKHFLMLSGWKIAGDYVVFAGDDLKQVEKAAEALKKWRR